jgi:LysM repeat protein
MNNPNPFVPQGSLLEQQSKRRSRLKIGVLCALAVGICGLAAMLIQGCKREETDNTGGDQGQPPVDTNAVAETDTNQPTMEASNPPVATAPPESAQQAPPPAPAPAPAPEPAPAPAPTENEYVVVRGDSFWKIAKANGVTVRAIKDANPGVDPAKLKVGQKLVIPAGTSSATAAPGMEGAAPADNGGGEVYTIKSGDTLSRIAKHFGVTVKAIEEANNLSSTKIYVGKKLTIPVAAPASAPEAAPAPAPAPAPTAEPAPAPAPSGPPPAQQNPPSNQ